MIRFLEPLFSSASVVGMVNYGVRQSGQLVSPLSLALTARPTPNVAAAEVRHARARDAASCVGGGDAFGDGSAQSVDASAMPGPGRKCGRRAAPGLCLHVASRRPR